MFGPMSESLCPIYTEKLLKLGASLTAAKTNKEIIKILIKFNNKYLMIPECWKILIELAAEKYGSYDKRTLRLMKKGRSHFYCLEEWQQMPAYFVKEYHIKWSYLSPFYMNIGLTNPTIYASLVTRLKELITFPHQHLKDIYEILDFHGPSPITHAMKKEYEKSCKLYQEFTNAGEDDEKWFECLKKLEVDKAVIDNIELRLGQGQHYANQAIWKYYISFMKNKNSADLLNVYGRYCRLFLSDGEAKGRYLMLKYGQFLKVWRDKIKKKKIFAIIRSLKSKEKKPQMIYFNNCTKPIYQSMAFRSPLIHYITQVAKAPVLHKLHQTCKYFFHQRPFPVCHRLIISDSGFSNNASLSYVEQSLFIKPVAFYSSNLQNLYLSKDVILESYNTDMDPKYFFSKIYKSEASNIRFLDSNIHEKDFECFAKSGTIKYMNVKETDIIIESGGLTDEAEARELLYSYGNELKNFNFL